MTRLDPELLPVLAPILAFPPPVSVEQIRGGLAASTAARNALQPQHPEVTTRDVLAGDVPVRIYLPPSPSGTLVIYAHGGGRITGDLEFSHAATARLAAETRATVVSVDYRLAPEHPGLTAVTDTYDALAWAAAHRDEIGCGTGPLVVSGASAGGGIAAGVALWARDHGGPAIDLQLLIYPMLDDTVTAVPPHLAGLVTWGAEANVLGWSACGECDAYVAPTRAADLSGLPPAYVEVGDCDLFLAEDLAYASRLAAAGVPLELHVWPGVAHSSENNAPDAAISRRIYATRFAAVTAL